MYLIAAIFALDAECLVEVSPTPTPTVSSALWAWVSCLWEVEKKKLGVASSTIPFSRVRPASMGTENDV